MKLMSIEQANLNDLIRVFFDETSAASGAKFLDTEISEGKDLNRLLRSHHLSSVGPGEMKKRDAIDDLLAFYSILEIAAFSP